MTHCKNNGLPVKEAKRTKRGTAKETAVRLRTYVLVAFGMSFMWHCFRNTYAMQMLPSLSFEMGLASSKFWTYSWYGVLMLAACCYAVGTYGKGSPERPRLTAFAAAVASILTCVNIVLEPAGGAAPLLVGVALACIVSIALVRLITGWAELCNLMVRLSSKRILYAVCASSLLSLLLAVAAVLIGPVAERTLSVVAPTASALCLWGAFFCNEPSVQPCDGFSDRRWEALSLKNLVGLFGSRWPLVAFLVFLLFVSTCTKGVFDVVVMEKTTRYMLLKHGVTFVALAVTMGVCLKTAGLERFAFAGWILLAGGYVTGLLLVAIGASTVLVHVGCAITVAARTCFEVFIFLNVLLNANVRTVGPCALLLIVVPESLACIVGYAVVPDVLLLLGYSDAAALVPSLVLLAGCVMAAMVLVVSAKVWKELAEKDPVDSQVRDAADDGPAAGATLGVRRAPVRSIVPDIPSDKEILANLERLAAEYDLTPRECDVALLVLRGYSAKRMAEALVVSVSTVQSHMRNLYRKLDIHGRQELIGMIERSR